MVTSTHLCPWGIKAHDLMKRTGCDIEGNHLESQESNKAYKEEGGGSEMPLGFLSLTENLMMGMALRALGKSM